MRDIPPIHPGRILADQYLADLGISQRKLARLIDVPPRRINQVIKGERAITADTSLRLGKLFGQSDIFWLNLQKHCEVELAHETSDLSRVFGSKPYRSSRGLSGGAKGTRTPDPHTASVVRYQLRHSPMWCQSKLHHAQLAFKAAGRGDGASCHPMTLSTTSWAAF
jgi:addiction module HigA family antidote